MLYQTVYQDEDPFRSKRLNVNTEETHILVMGFLLLILAVTQQHSGDSWNHVLLTLLPRLGTQPSAICNSSREGPEDQFQSRIPCLQTRPDPVLGNSYFWTSVKAGYIIMDLVFQIYPVPCNPCSSDKTRGRTNGGRQ